MKGSRDIREIRLAVQGSEMREGAVKGTRAEVADDVRQFPHCDATGFDPIVNARGLRFSTQLVQHFGRDVERDHPYAGFGERDRLKAGAATQLEHLLTGSEEPSEMGNGNPSEMKVERVPLDHPIILWCRRIEQSFDGAVVRKAI
jgi:hypothetical protein